MDRLRWDNIARAAAVLAVIALVIAWPHLKGSPPNLPPAAATPVSIDQPRPTAAPAPRLVKPPRAAPEPRRPKRRAQRRPHRAPRRVPPRALVPPPPPPVVAPPVPVPSASDAAAREFAVP